MIQGEDVRKASLVSAAVLSGPHAPFKVQTVVEG
jgi:hypothetical protein